MVIKTDIIKTLNRLDDLYKKSKSSRDGYFYSKLAMLEFCGWIEDSMDDIILRCAIRQLKELSNRNDVKGTLVGKTYGFKYATHFRNMLTTLLGLVNIEKLEKKVDQVKFDKFKSILGTLQKKRNNEAHTHLGRITKIIDAPSVTKMSFTIVYDGLKEFEETIKKLNL